MGIKTAIEYCDSTANLTSGCNGCELWIPGKGGDCYAGGVHSRFRAQPGNPVNPAYPGPFEQVDLQLGRMEKAVNWSDLTGTERPEKPWMNGMPRVIFISDMSDALSREVPFDYLASELIAHVDTFAGRRHRWMWFTKQPRRMAKFSRWLQQRGIDWPDHLMAVTSITSAKTVKRLRWLCEVRCMLRGISFEPMLGPITPQDLHKQLPAVWFDMDFALMCEIDWAAFGGVSQPKRHKIAMKPEWPRELIDYFDGTLGTPCFFKQWGQFVEFEQAPADVAVEIDRAGYMPGDGPVSVGKKRAGRLLDERTWDGMPKAWKAATECPLFRGTP